MLAPKLPDYDLATWAAKPYPDRVRMVCQSWASDGYGAPLSVYVVYLLKIVAYVVGWMWFCTFTPGWTFENLATWWATPTAFTKAILFTMAFEGLGLGCGSGPLTARYLPPVGPLLYFLRPGTTKLPLFSGLPIIGGHQRTLLDVALYAATLGLLGLGLTAAAVEPWHLWPLLVLLPLAGLGDRTLFLVFRSEHYLSVVVCLTVFATDWIAGAKLVWMAIWWGAATSKLNHHFPSVMCVMTSNCPWTQFTPLRRWVYRNPPEDLRPSGFAHVLAHFGTATEYLVPLVLLLSGGGLLTWTGLFIIVGFHLFILSNFPMGVPLEWNVIMIYGALVLFGVHADVSVLALDNPWLWAWIIGFHFVLPLFGSMYPQYVSFLLAHRYYAGNWPYSVWLFRGDAMQKLNRVNKWSPLLRTQLRVLYDDATIDAMLAKVLAFRHMHLLGGALKSLVPRAVDDIDEYDWLDGELVAGMVLGWNFGDGHLSSLQMMRAVQAQCGFEPGELRCIFVESQPIHRTDAQWCIADAHDGVLERGAMTIAEMAEDQPWPKRVVHA